MFENVFSDKISVDNYILKLIKLSNKKINDVVLSFGLDTEIYSLSIARSLTKNCIIFTFRFYDLITHKNFYEIEIKIELKHKWLADAVLAANSVLSEALNKAAEFEIKHGKEIEILIYSMIIVTIIMTIIINFPLIVAAAGGFIAGAGVAALQFVHSLSFEIPFFQPAVQYIKIP